MLNSKCADVAKNGLSAQDYEDMNNIFGDDRTNGNISFFCNNTLWCCRECEIIKTENSALKNKIDQLNKLLDEKANKV